MAGVRYVAGVYACFEISSFEEGASDRGMHEIRKKPALRPKPFWDLAP